VVAHSRPWFEVCRRQRRELVSDSCQEALNAVVLYGWMGLDHLRPLEHPQDPTQNSVSEYCSQDMTKSYATDQHTFRNATAPRLNIVSKSTDNNIPFSVALMRRISG
jgi:hypothetical protein